MNNKADNIERLLVDALKATNEGRIDWRAESDIKFAAIVLARGGIAITSLDADGMHPYQFDLVGPDGEVIEFLRSGSDDAINSNLYDLYHGAKRKALGVEDVMRGVRSALGIRRSTSEDDIPF